MEDRKLACRRIRDLGAPYVVIKGGHEEGSGKVTDLLYDGSDFIEFSSERIATRHTHGTGCTFASAIAAELAKGRSVADAVFTAKRFIDRAIQSPLGIGGGHGPLNHFAWRGDH
jgi:hydroxymethylpyrimidine/phosphomethylpyrimidine kinase